MGIIGLLAALAGFIGLITAAATLVHPMRRLRIPTRKVAAIVGGASLAALILGGALLSARVRSGSAIPATDSTTAVTATPAHAHRIRPVRLVGRAAIAVAHLIPGIN